MVWLLLYLYILYIKIFALMIFWWPLQSVWPAAQKLPYSIDYVHKRWALGTCMWTMETSTLPRCNGEPLPSICVSIKILPAISKAADFNTTRNIYTTKYIHLIIFWYTKYIHCSTPLSVYYNILLISCQIDTQKIHKKILCGKQILSTYKFLQHSTSNHYV